MIPSALPPKSPAGRIPAIDALRGVALLAMTGFHFSWDLEMFGILPAGFMAQAGPVWTARIIASSFLFLAGVGLFLAHGEEFRPAGYFPRLGKIVAAAALISLATWFATPDAFIFFGILHLIAFASVAGLAFMRLPALVTAIAGMAILAAGTWISTPALDAPIWWWTGLSRFIPRSNDYVPVFPFLGPVLLGMAAVKIARERKLLETIGRFRLAGPLGAGIRFLGRHSLVYYLLHQPIMIGFLFVILMLNGRI